MSSILIVGQSWSDLTRSLASHFSTDVIPLTVAQFADTETFVSIENDQRIAGASVLLVYPLSYFNHVSSSPTRHGSLNDQLVGILQAIDLVQQMKAKTIHVLLPYLPYSRQDVSVCKRYQGAIFMLGKCLKALGVQHLAACDLHAPSIQKSFPLDLYNIDVSSFWQQVITRHIAKNQPRERLCILSPDEGGKHRAQELASSLNVSYAVVHKVRIAPDTTVSHELVGDVRGKTVIIRDDIIDTAQTARGALDLAFHHGATAAYGCFTHAVFAQGARELLAASPFEKIFITDSIIGLNDEHSDKIQIVSLREYLVHALEKWAGSI
jgi:ribose-phosphate pyrophosphokinase